MEILKDAFEKILVRKSQITKNFIDERVYSLLNIQYEN